MKKTTAVLSVMLSVLIISGALSSCSAGSQYTERAFSPELLSYAHLEDMPLPDSETYGVKINDDPENEYEAYAFACTKAEFEAYVRALAAYLSANRDIYYFGYVDKSPSIIMLIPDYTVCRVGDDYDYTLDEQVFQYSLTGELDGEYLDDLKYEDFEDVIEIRVMYGCFNENEKFDALIAIMREPRLSGLDREYFTETEGASGTSDGIETSLE